MGAHNGSTKTSLEATELAGARYSGGHGQKPCGGAGSSRVHWKVYCDPDKVDPENESDGWPHPTWANLTIKI